MKNGKIKVFIAEDFDGNLYHSTISHEDISLNTTASLMPGGFSTSELSKKQLEKLSDGAYLIQTKRGLIAKYF